MYAPNALRDDGLGGIHGPEYHVGEAIPIHMNRRQGQESQRRSMHEKAKGPETPEYTVTAGRKDILRYECAGRLRYM